jgi:hypothetical protein
MSKEKIEYIRLDKIKNAFDVRVALDQDRVVQLAGMYESGVNLPPVKVVRLDEEYYAYIDGRTRGEARKYLNLEEIAAVVCNGSLREDPIELYAEALEANCGGAKPPTTADLTHSILRMLECGATQKQIRERLTFLPSGALQAYIAIARGNLNKKRMAKAIDAIGEGATVQQAAESCHVKPEALKDAISGKKRKWGTARSNEVQLAVDMKAYISKVLFSANAGIAQKCETILKRVDDGEISVKTANGILKAWREHLRKTGLRVDDWQARLDSISLEQDKAVAAPVASAQANA